MRGPRASQQTNDSDELLAKGDAYVREETNALDHQKAGVAFLILREKSDTLM
jgi:hypothetical protein